MRISSERALAERVPVVSVIIPAYGRPLHLRAAVDSVLQGGCDETEILIIDDGSPNPLRDAIEDLIVSGTVRYHRQTNGGTATARNTGARMASGEFLLFLDDDDLVVPGSIAARLSALRSRPALSGVFGRYNLLIGDTVIPQEEVAPPEVVDRWTHMAFNQLISPGQAIIRASHFHEVGGFSTDCIGSDDWDLWIRLCARSGMWRMSEFALTYREHGGNFSKNLIPMSKGALSVAKRSRSLACGSHRPTVRYLTQNFVNEIYGSKLSQSIPSLLEKREWKTLVSYSWMRFVLASKAFYGRALFKVALVKSQRKWSVPDATNLMTGRGCSECNSLAPGRSLPSHLRHHS